MSRRLVRDLLVPLPFSSILPRGPARNPAFRGARSAGRRRDDPDAVRGQPGAMADASNVRHDTIVVPERMSPAQVRRGRSGRLKFKSATTTWWPVLHLHGSRPVGGEYGTEVEWRYSYQVIPPGGAATDTAD